MKRYKITRELRKAIKNNKYSMRKISKILGFQVKHICNTNISINEDHLQRLGSFLNLNLDLKEIKFDYAKNLGKYASFSHPIKPIKKSGELAEFMGIMLGDGNIYKNQLKISFDKRTEDYINYVKKLTKKIFDIELRIKFAKKANRADLYYYNKDLIEKLLEFGLKRGSKIQNQLGIPKWVKDNQNYAERCIKGLIDTDGCIFVCKREKQKYINFTNHNKKLFEDFKEVTKNLGYSFAKSNKTNTRLYRKDEVVKFINAIKPLKSIYGVMV